jgi:hypothetical protein
MTITTKIFALIGLILTILIIIGLIFDIRNFDRTKGGYNPPYKDVTGEPVDWDSMDLTSTGLAKRGFVVNILVNGTSGMISFEIFNQTVDWRTFSDRALVAHNPREALIKRGFRPEF